MTSDRKTDCSLVNNRNTAGGCHGAAIVMLAINAADRFSRFVGIQARGSTGSWLRSRCSVKCVPWLPT